MALHAISHLSKLDVRSVVALDLAGISIRSEDDEIESDLLSVIRDPERAIRTTTVPGPILFYRDMKDSKQYAIDMRKIFLHADRELRLAALEHFVAATGPQPIATMRSLSLLRDSRLSLLSTDERTWRTTAVRLHDELDNDLLTQLSGVRQSILERYEDGLQDFVPRLMKPTFSSLESANLQLLDPLQRAEDFETAVDEVVQASSVRSLMERYIGPLAALPLAGRFSFTAALERWLTAKQQQSSVWPELWSAATDLGPIARFCACSHFMARPIQVPDDIGRAIVESMLSIIAIENADEDGENADSWYWRIASELASHYIRHFETIVPAFAGTGLVSASWWLAHQVASAFCTNIAAAKHLRDIAVIPNARQSDLEWRFANPATPLKPAVQVAHWQMPIPVAALLASISAEAATYLSGILSDTQRTSINGVVTRWVSLWSPTHTTNVSDTAYLFEGNLRESAANWGIVSNDRNRSNAIRSMADHYIDMEDTEKCLAKFDELGNLPAAEQVLASNALRLLSIRGQLPIDRVLPKMFNSTWQLDNLQKLCAVALEQLFFAIAISMHRVDERSASSIAHAYAQACESRSVTDDIREMLFICTVFTCVHTYSMGAVERLVSGPQSSQLAQFAMTWRELLSNIGRSASPWVAARLRGASAVMSAALVN